MAKKGRGSSAGKWKGLKELLEGAVASVEALKQRTGEQLAATRSTYAGDVEGGVSYLDVKQQLLASYNLLLAQYCVLKVEGGVREHPVVGELVRLRSVLEKLRPLDKKLRFQIDKLLRMAPRDGDPAAEESLDGDGGGGGLDQGSDSAADGGDGIGGLHFRPRPEMLEAVQGGLSAGAASRLGSDGDDGAGGEESIRDALKGGAGAGEDGVYRAPRMAAVPYSEGSKETEKEERRARRARERLNRSELIQSLREELSDAPELVSGMATGGSQLTGMSGDAVLKLRREDAERRHWEEERFIRSSMSKKDKLERRRQEKMASTLDTLAEFTADADAFSEHFREADERSREQLRAARKRKTKGAPRNKDGALQEAMSALADKGAAYDQRASNKKRRNRL